VEEKKIRIKIGRGYGESAAKLVKKLSKKEEYSMRISVKWNKITVKKRNRKKINK
jgi:hypothetical protein